MVKTIVVALGGNAILDKSATYWAQKDAVNRTAAALVELVKRGNRLVVTHGNGPQVGNLLLQQLAADSERNPALPLDTLGAMTEGSIGYWLANSLDNYFHAQGMDMVAVPVITQSVVDDRDPAFRNPTKPIGPFYTEEEVRSKMIDSPETVYKEDSGRGWRRVVASPRPTAIKEIDGIKALVKNGNVVIAAGGGGIPVVEQDGDMIGREAVIDKDRTSSQLAIDMEADELLILTGVDNIYEDWGKPTQRPVYRVTADELDELIKVNDFGEGSMLPKLRAAQEFVRARPSSRAVITSLEKLDQYLEDKAGTVITD